MAIIKALPTRGGESNTLIDFKKELLDNHQNQLLLAYDLALKMLQQYGTDINQKWKSNSIKKLETELYELRVKSIRTFLYFDGNDFYIILHSFIKKTQKTPNTELQKAREEIRKWKALKKELNY